MEELKHASTRQRHLTDPSKFERSLDRGKTTISSEKLPPRVPEGNQYQDLVWNCCRTKFQGCQHPSITRSQNRLAKLPPQLHNSSGVYLVTTWISCHRDLNTRSSNNSHVKRERTPCFRHRFQAQQRSRPTKLCQVFTSRPLLSTPGGARYSSFVFTSSTPVQFHITLFYSCTVDVITLTRQARRKERRGGGGGWERE